MVPLLTPASEFLFSEVTESLTNPKIPEGRDKGGPSTAAFTLAFGALAKAATANTGPVNYDTIPKPHAVPEKDKVPHPKVPPPPPSEKPPLPNNANPPATHLFSSFRNFDAFRGIPVLGGNRMVGESSDLLWRENECVCFYLCSGLSNRVRE